MAKQKKPKPSPPQPQPATKEDIEGWLELATDALIDARDAAGSLGLTWTKARLEQAVKAVREANDAFAAELGGEEENTVRLSDEQTQQLIHDVDEAFRRAGVDAKKLARSATGR